MIHSGGIRVPPVFRKKNLMNLNVLECVIHAILTSYGGIRVHTVLRNNLFSEFTVTKLKQRRTKKRYLLGEYQSSRTCQGDGCHKS